jgi:hypothetical protein
MNAAIGAGDVGLTRILRRSMSTSVANDCFSSPILSRVSGISDTSGIAMWGIECGPGTRLAAALPASRVRI